MTIAAPRSGKVRVGIVGVGNCASSFVQGLTYYSHARANEPVPGLMHADLGGYHVGDVEVSAAFDAERALEAGCAFVNCIPVFIASNPEWRRRFEQRGVPLIGDDIKSQVGATIVHRVLANLFRERGVRLDRTYQLNFGGNSDFKNMLERERLASKKISKTQSVTSQLDVPLAADNIHVGPSDYVP